MNKLIAVMGVILFASGLAAQQSAASAPQRIAIRAGALIDGTSNEAKRDQVIVIQGNRIESVGPFASFKPAAGMTVIDLSKLTVLPGMIDAHTHLFLQGQAPETGGYDVHLLKYSLAYRSARAVVAARRALEQGFTTIRDLETEGAGYADVGIKQAVEEGHVPGPRIFTTTRAISTTGGYPLEGYAPEFDWPKGVQIIDGPVEARKAAREQMANGADWIKVYMTHRSWLDEKGSLVSQPTLTLEEVRAIVDETHGWERKVACHAYNGVGMQRALDGGCDSIEHGLELTDANVAQMVKQGTWYCPTMTPYNYYWGDANSVSGKKNRKRAEVHIPSVGKAYKAGVKMAFGTDVGGFPWSDPIAQEFGYLAKAGVNPMDAIKMATSNAAEMLGRSGQLGVITPGAFADIAAVAGDPLANLEALKNVQFVMKDGVVFKQ